MATLEEEFHTLTTPGPNCKLPGAVLLAYSSTGAELYSASFGSTSIDPTKSHPLTPNSIFWIASCTKLLTSISALQLVERGLIALDDPVAPHLPELSSPDIITSIDPSGTPILTKATVPITLRHLITHTSGLAYEFLHPHILAWWKWRGLEPHSLGGDITKVYGTPLIAEPGSAFTYSPGLDWAGLLISRLTNVPQLGDYFRTHIFPPLDIPPVGSAAYRQSDFNLSQAKIDERWTQLTIRLQPNTNEPIIFLPSPPENTTLAPHPPLTHPSPKDDMGGSGLYTTPSTYIKILVSILANDGKLLSPSTVATMFQPAITPTQRSSLLSQMTPQVLGRMASGGLPLPADTDPATIAAQGGEQEYHHGPAGLLNRPKGSTGPWTLSWSGLPNLFWFINPSSGICGHYASAIIPPGDPLSIDMNVKFRLEMEKRFGRKPEPETTSDQKSSL